MNPRAVLLARARILSSARCAKFGVLPDDAGVWWQQIQTVAEELALPMTWDEWQAKDRKDQQELPL